MRRVRRAVVWAFDVVDATWWGVMDWLGLHPWITAGVVVFVAAMAIGLTGGPR